MDYKRLSECAYYRSERTTQIDYETYISTENMLPNKSGITTAETLPDLKSTSKYLPNDILLSNIRPYFKKIWLSDCVGGCSNDVLVVIAKDNIIPKFLYYVLSDNNFFNYDTVTSKGTKMPRGTPKAIMKYLVPDVDKDYQKKVVSILSAYDGLIDTNNKRIKALEQMAENLYKEWFVRFRFPGHETAEFENGIPKAWGYVKLGEAVTFIDGDRGSNYPTQDEFSEDGYCLFLNAGNVTKSGFDFTNCSYITKEKDTLLKKGKLNNGDVVLTTRGTVGNSAFYNTKIKNKNVRINSGMVIIRGKELLSSEYIYTLLNDDYIKAMISLYSSGSAQPQLPIKDLKRIRILMPDEKTMKQFTELVKKIYDEISIVNMCNMSIIKQRDLLLPRLMSGKLEV